MAKDQHSSLVRQAKRAPIGDAATVYGDIADLLRRAGWARGVGRDRRGRYSLREAVDAVVASTVSDAVDRVSRSARCCNHLRELAGTTNLDAWNDAHDRRRNEVFDLLLMASRRHPTD